MLSRSWHYKAVDAAGRMIHRTRRKGNELKRWFHEAKQAGLKVIATGARS
jgi:hypothetical protein